MSRKRGLLALALELLPGLERAPGAGGPCGVSRPRWTNVEVRPARLQPLQSQQRPAPAGRSPRPSGSRGGGHWSRSPGGRSGAPSPGRTVAVRCWRPALGARGAWSRNPAPSCAFARVCGRRRLARPWGALRLHRPPRWAGSAALWESGVAGVCRAQSPGRRGHRGAHAPLGAPLLWLGLGVCISEMWWAGPPRVSRAHHPGSSGGPSGLCTENGSRRAVWFGDRITRLPHAP